MPSSSATAIATLAVTANLAVTAKLAVTFPERERAKSRFAC
jgi:hypothetical protein